MPTKNDSRRWRVRASAVLGLSALAMAELRGAQRDFTAPHRGRPVPARATRSGIAMVLFAVTVFCRAAQAGAPPTPPTFAATYSVAWHGITAGTSTLTLTQTEPGRYRYTSDDNATGVFRLFIRQAIQQQSVFTIVDGEVRPLSYRAAGNGPTEEANFDWARNRVIGTAKGKPLDLALQPGTQDPGSVQIALMLALLAGRPPASFWMLNTDVINQFQFVYRGKATLDTPLGPLDTVLYTSHHAGARRTTYMWLAPSLDYLPARLEQHRGDDILFSLNVLSFSKR